MRSLIAALIAPGLCLLGQPSLAQTDDSPKETDLLAYVLDTEPAELNAASEGRERVVLVQRPTVAPDFAALYVLSGPSIYADSNVLLHVPNLLFSDTSSGPPAGLEPAEGGGVIVHTQVVQGAMPWSERLLLREIDGEVKVAGYAAKFYYSPTGSHSICDWDLTSGDWTMSWADIDENGKPGEMGEASGNQPENISAAKWGETYQQMPEICVKPGLQTY